MPRILPWLKPTSASSSSSTKTKDKARANLPESQSSDSSEAGQDQRRRKRVKPEESDHDDDENWRMTESELAATAQLWTRDLHQKAYEKLFEVQQRELERSKTLTELLDQPLAQQILPPLPPRIALIKSKPESDPVTMSSSESKSKKIHQRSESKLNSVSKHQLSSTNGLDATTKPLMDQGSNLKTSLVDTTPRKTPKLSEAALARRRRREQERKPDAAVVPLF